MVFVLFANEKRKGGQIFGKKFEEQTMTNPVKNYRARTPNNQPNPIDVFIRQLLKYVFVFLCKTIEGTAQRRGRLSLLPTDCSRCVKIFRKRRDEKKLLAQ